MYAAWLLVLVARVSARGRFWLGSGPHAKAAHTTVPRRDMRSQDTHLFLFVPACNMMARRSWSAPRHLQIVDELPYGASRLVLKISTILTLGITFVDLLDYWNRHSYGFLSSGLLDECMARFHTCAKVGACGLDLAEEQHCLCGFQTPERDAIG